MSDIVRFIEEMPKAELHLHIEGSLEPEQMFALAQRNKVELPYESVEAVRQAYDFTNLQDFLDIYYQGMSVLQTRADFHDLTWAYLTRVHAQNVTHTEIFFDPQGHTERGVAFETVLDGIDDALTRARDELGMTSRLIIRRRSSPAPSQPPARPDSAWSRTRARRGRRPTSAVPWTDFPSSGSTTACAPWRTRPWSRVWRRPRFRSRSARSRT